MYSTETGITDSINARHEITLFYIHNKDSIFITVFNATAIQSVRQ